MNDLQIQIPEKPKAKIVPFRKPKKEEIVTKCSFCNEALVKGKFVQSEPTAPAICLSCVGVCTELLKEE